MSKKLTLILTGALVVAGIVAIVAPTVLALEGQKSLDAANSFKEKSLKELKFNETWANANLKEQTVAQINEKLAAVENKKTLFDVINENNNVVNDAVTSVESAILTANPTSKTYEVNFAITWVSGEEYYIPVNWLTTAPAKYSNLPAATDNAVATLRGIEGVAGATSAAGLATALNADKDSVKKAIDTNVVVGTVVVVAAETGGGYNITIPYTVTNSIIPSGSIVISNFTVA